jgi:xanthine/uracil/vitamin C permease (AzgA family)
MKIGQIEFNLQELAGATGDFGTLFPLALGFMVVCGLNPAGLLVMLGLANLICGLAYRLPLPVEPMKVIAAVAIAQAWSPSLVYASGFAMGLVWIALGLTGFMKLLAKATPHSVVIGIQVALGVLLARQALQLMSSWWELCIISLILALILRKSTRLPGAIALIFLGIGVVLWQGQWPAMVLSFSMPSFTTFSLQEVWQSMVLAGFSQIPLTAANAVIATAALVKRYWPEKGEEVTEGKLALNIGIMNLISPFLGGMPMCHGAGGLAAKHFFGARTEGANVIEGTMEIAAGIFLAGFIVQLIAVFPDAVIGTMLLLVGLELIGYMRDARLDRDLIPIVVTVLVSLIGNMAYGFLAGLIVHYIIHYVMQRYADKRFT